MNEKKLKKAVEYIVKKYKKTFLALEKYDKMSPEGKEKENKKARNYFEHYFNFNI